MSTVPSPPVSPHPGARFGMPPHGPGSMATFTRRAAAAILDWVLSQAFAAWALGVPWGSTGVRSFVPLAVFAALNLVCVATVGRTPGMALLGLQVGQIRPGFFPVQVLVRTALLSIFLPAILTDGDGRGLHDRFAGTVIVRRR